MVKQWFTYNACGPLIKNKERIQKFKETGDTNYIYKNELDKAWLDMDYRDFKGLARRTASDKVLRDKAFYIAKNSKYDGYQREIASMVYKFFDKKSVGSGLNKHANNKCPLVLAEELQKPDIRKLKKQQFIQDLKTIFGELV